MRLTPKQMELKIKAAESYQTQVALVRPYANERYLRAQAAVRGMQCGAEWAEAFEAIRLCSTL